MHIEVSFASETLAMYYHHQKKNGQGSRIGLAIRRIISGCLTSLLAPELKYSALSITRRDESFEAIPAKAG